MCAVCAVWPHLGAVREEADLAVAAHALLADLGVVAAAEGRVILREVGVHQGLKTGRSGMSLGDKGVAPSYKQVATAPPCIHMLWAECRHNRKFGLHEHACVSYREGWSQYCNTSWSQGAGREKEGAAERENRSLPSGALKGQRSQGRTYTTHSFPKAWLRKARHLQRTSH